MDLRTAASLPVLLAAYRAETDGSDAALTVAQNVVERLIDGDVFGRLAEVRDALCCWCADNDDTFAPNLTRALDTLNDLLTPED